MKVQIVKRNEHFFVRTKTWYGLYKYLAIHRAWWTVFIRPHERYYGFNSLSHAKDSLNEHIENEKSNRKFLASRKEKDRLRKNPMIVVEEFEIEI